MRVIAGIIALVCFVSCGQNKPSAAQKHYSLTGKVVSIDSNAHTATIDAAAIPNFMEAMKMDYPIAPDFDVNSLKPGENITGTVNVDSDGSYTLSDIHDAGQGASGAAK